MPTPSEPRPSLFPTRRWRACGAALLTAATLGLLATPAHAQRTPKKLSAGLSTPAEGIATLDDSRATLVNPANLALMPSWETRFGMIYTGEEARQPVRGYSVDLAVPLWLFGTGLHVDWMEAPNAAAPPWADSNDGHRSTWIRWGAATQLGSAASFGTTLSWSKSDAANLDDFFSITSALTIRPNRFVSAAVVARDWNSPENDAGRIIDPSVDAAIAFRPISGLRTLELGLEGSYRVDLERWVPTVNLGLAIPYVGRLRSGVQLLDAGKGEAIATTVLDVNLDNFQATGGVIYGNSLGLDGTGVVAGAALRGHSEKPRIPLPAHVVRLRFESTPNIRGHVRLLRGLWRLADDPEVDGVLLELRSNPAPSFAHAEELVDALRLLKSKGKKVLCHLEDASARELFVCSEADRIAVNPAGGVRFSGLSSRFLYFGGLLDKLGVRADFVRIGAHKLAPEQFTDGSSTIGKEDHRRLLQTYEKIYLEQLARGRKMSVAEAKASIAKGPFIASEARAAKLVDQLVYEDEIERFVEEAFGERIAVRDYAPVDSGPKYWRQSERIAVVYLDGNMVDGNSQTLPLVGIKLAGSYTISKALKQARSDPNVKAVVLRVETGGGSSLASDVILREVTLTAKVKPLIVSMGSRAASGGYYASVGGREIFASRATLTGSIGIFYGKVDVVGLLDKLGVKTEGIRTSPMADAESFFRPFSDDERQVLGVKVKQFYDLFVGRVAEGRKLTPARVHAVAQGQVWLGDRAKQHGLIDQIGGLRQALEHARKQAGLAPDTPIIELPREQTTLFQEVLKLAGVPSLKAGAWVPPPIKDIAMALAPFMVHEAHKPLARMEVLIQEP